MIYPTVVFFFEQILTVVDGTEIVIGWRKLEERKETYYKSFLFLFFLGERGIEESKKSDILFDKNSVGTKT